MNKLDELLVNEIKSDRLIDLDFIKKYIYYFINVNHLNLYYHGLVNDNFNKVVNNNLIAGYNPKDKKIYINDDDIIDNIIYNCYLKDKDAYSKQDMIYIYSMYLNVITHELFHVKQQRDINSFDKSPLVILIRDSFKMHDKYYDFYLSNHNIFTSEVNASISASMYVYSLFMKNNLLDNEFIKKQYHNYVASLIINSYKDEDEFTSPTLRLYENFKDGEKVYKLNKDITSNNLVRISYGMPCSNDLLSKIDDIRENNEEISDIKKMILKYPEYQN